MKYCINGTGLSVGIEVSQGNAKSDEWGNSYIKYFKLGVATPRQGAPVLSDGLLDVLGLRQSST